MKDWLNAFNKLIAIASLSLILSPAVCDIVRDKTLDYECRPRWDRFIVDENTTNWDKDSVTCYDRYGNRVETSKLYGAPKVYGEFEPEVQSINNVKKLYGTLEDMNAASLYGRYDEAYPLKKDAFVKPILVVKQNNLAKKTAVSSNFVKNTKPVSPKLDKKTIPILKSSVPVEILPEAKKDTPSVAADKKANAIAKTLSDTVDIDTFCRQINPPILGEMPKGVILMPGRTDLMSCVKK